MKGIQTRALVEGAIFASITVLIGILSFYIPLIYIIVIIWPVPTILIGFRHGLKVSIYSAVIAAVLVIILTQPLHGLDFIIRLGIPGVVMGYMLKKKVDPLSTIMISSIVFTICIIAIFILSMLATGMDIVKAFDQMFIDMKASYHETANSMAGLYQSAGISPGELQKQAEAFEKGIDMLKTVIPGFILLGALFIAFINFKVSRLILSRINIVIDDVKPFSLWRLPNNAMILVSTLLFLTVIELNFVQIPQLNDLSINVLVLIQYLLSVLGLSVAVFAMGLYSVPKAVKVLIVIFVVLVFGQVLMFVGLADMIFDFRKFLNKSKGT